MAIVHYSIHLTDENKYAPLYMILASYTVTIAKTNVST